MSARILVSCWTFFVVAAAASAQIVQSPPPAAETALAPRQGRAAFFLSKIRLADPGYQLVLMACLKERELNLLLSRQVSDEEIPLLVKGLLGQLSREFPGEDLSVVAFKPTVPLREAGVARLNSRTGEITYTGG